MSDLNTSLRPRFSPEDDSPLGLTINGMQLRYGGPITVDGIGLQLFPDVPATLVATNGIITKGPGYVVKGIDDVLIFRGSDLGSTGLPVDKLVRVQNLDSPVDKDGKPVTVTLSLDAERRVIKASKPCYGAFRVTYDVSYHQYYWKHSGVVFGNINYLGTVLAVYQGSTAVLDIDIDVTPDKTNVTEVYRVTSEYVADDQGQWEKPQNFPDQNSYPNGTVEGPDQDSFQLLERVHEAGFVNTFGQYYYRLFTVRTLQPYEYSNSYKPVLTFRQASNPGTKFVEAFNNLDITKIKAEVKSRWPTVTGI